MAPKPVSGEALVAYYLDQFRSGNTEEAFFGLLETDCDLLANIATAFRKEERADVREFLVRVLREDRRAETIVLLAEALRDSEPAVWRQAMSALVALGTSAAVSVLEDARAQTCASTRGSEEFRQWLEEAIEQARAAINQ